MDAQLAPGFQKELPTLLGRVIEDLCQMLDIEAAIDAEAGELCTLADVFADCGRGAVCCRSIFIRKVNGIGGLLLPDDAADQLSRAALMMDPPEEGEEFDFPGVGREALEEIFNIVVGSWNTTSSPDYRLGSKTEERSVEYYPAHLPFPEAAGVFPCVLRFPFSLGTYSGFIAVFVPIKAIHGREVAAFIPPTQFVKDTAPNATAAAAAAAATATPPPVESPLAKPRYEGPLKPVVFLDYTGQILRWLRARANEPNTTITLSPQLEPPPSDHLPAATILVGISPEALGELEDTAFVEIRQRDSQS